MQDVRQRLFDAMGEYVDAQLAAITHNRMHKRHHFSVEVRGGILHAYVPDEGGSASPLERLRRDDLAWCGDVHDHGMEDYFERIDFQFKAHGGI